MATTEGTEGDFAIVVYREEECWEAAVLPAAVTSDLRALVRALRQQPSIGSTIGLAGVGDDFFLLIRVTGGKLSYYLSDLTAAVDFPLAAQVLADLDLPVPGPGELDQVLPAGDMSILADLGLDEMDLGAMSADLDLYPDEAVLRIGEKLGFGMALSRALDELLGP